MKKGKEVNKEPKGNGIIKLKADIYWCQHQKPNEMSERFQVNLCNLSDIATTALETHGIKVNIGEDEKAPMGHYITCKSLHPIYIHDANGVPITTRIGNGSKGVAVVGFYEWTFKNKKGISPSLKELVITELVEYEHSVNINLDDEDIL